MGTPWVALAAGISGEVVLPPSPRYEALRRPADARFHGTRPRAVVRCATAGDVAETIAFVRRARLPAVIRSGGHDFAGGSSTAGVVIDVTPMNAVSQDGSIGAGARLAEVYDTLSENGRTIPAGCGPTVGIAGLTLGGGLGVLGRSHGLTSDSLRAAEVVLADGRILTCDEHRHDDLFWALRGGTGLFGAVTALTFDTVPAPALTRFRMTWPYRTATALVEAWQAWAPSGPDELAASLHLTVPADPAEAPNVAVVGTMVGHQSDATSRLEDLVARAGADPEHAEQHHASHRETKRMLAADDRRDHAERFTFTRSGFLTHPLPHTAVAELTRHLVEQRTAGQMRVLDFTPWGGAYNRVPADATAFVHRGELFLLQHVVVVEPPGSVAARGWLRESDRLAAPWRSGAVYQNFPDPDLLDAARAYFGANLRRLSRVKAKYDPDGFFGSLTGK
jgi:FAD/FMN-containing dehydrogenase